MVTPGTSGIQLVCSSSCGSSNGRVEAYTTWPRMPPFSPAAKGFLPNSMNEFCPEKPCQPSLVTHGGSMRPVDSLVVQVVAPVEGEIVQALGGLLLPAPAVIEWPLQSAPAQYTAPGTRSAAGTDTVSKVFAMFAAIVELPQGALDPPHVPSAGPPASYTT